jgi:O-antigen ligase
MNNKQTIVDTQIFWVCLVFLFSIYFINLSQYIVIFLFGVLLLYLARRLHNLTLSAALVSIISFCIQIGKTYEVLLLAPGEVSPIRAPEGYSIIFSFTINHIVGILLLGLIIQGILNKKFLVVKLLPLDVLIFSLFVLSWFSALFGSKMPEYSSIYALLSLSTAIKYVFFRLNSDMLIRHKSLFLSIIASMLMFESIIALIQYVNSGPLAKTIELQKHLEEFGGGTDEINFVFRPVGTFGHANYLSAFFALCSSIIFATYVTNGNYIYLFAFILSLVANALTLSRGGWVALVPFFIAFRTQLIMKFRQLFSHISLLNKLLLLISSLVISITIIIPRVIQSMNINSSDIGNGLGIRVSQFENALQLIILHPLLGTGGGMSVIEGYGIDPLGVMWQFPSSIHNIYALYAVENGVPAMIIYVFIILYLLMRLIKRYSHSYNSNRIVYKGLIVGFLGINLIGLLQPYDFLELLVLFAIIFVI